MLFVLFLISVGVIELILRRSPGPAAVPTPQKRNTVTLSGSEAATGSNHELLSLAKALGQSVPPGGFREAVSPQPETLEKVQPSRLD